MITLEEYSGYLAHKLQLKCSAIFRPNHKEHPLMKGSDATLTCDLLADIENGTYNEVGYFKPIFHPLSDLIREIEVNGEKFVPIYKLLNADLGDIDIVFEESKLEYLSRWKIYALNKEDNIYPKREFMESIPINVSTWPFYRVQKLYEWHFWIGDQSRFGQDIIDINTLNQ